MRANQALRNVVVYSADVIFHAEKAGCDSQMQDRCQAIASNFLESVPEAVLYLLKFILHKWPDEAYLKVRRNCRKAARPSSTFNHLRTPPGPSCAESAGIRFDLTMLVRSGARERTLEE